MKMPDQRLVVYDTAKSHGLVYDTAYDNDQIQDAVKRCLDFHGVRSNVRAVAAKGHLGPRLLK